jgi:hypothetical protein
MADALTPEQLALLEKQLSRSEDYLKVQKQLRDLAKENGESASVQLEYEVSIAREQKKQLEIKKELGILDAQEAENYVQKLKELDEIEKRFNKQKNALDNIGKKIKFVGEAWKESFIGSIIDSGLTADQLGSKLKETFSPANITGSFLLAFQDATLAAVAQAGELRGEVVGATGNIEAFDTTVMGASTGAMQFGVGLAEAAKATSALSQSMSGFSSAAPALQQELVQTAASFENLGVSASTFGANMQIAQKSFGMTGNEALGLQKDMAALAAGIGVPIGQLAQDFNSNASAFAAYGKAGIKMFEDLARQSKETGIAMNELLGITQQFDTFEGAADAAGKLNAILGGGIVDSMQLLGATEAQRIDILRNSVAASGRSFDSMHRLERMAIANAAGITDMNQAMAMFSEEAQRNAKAADQNALSQEKLEEIQRASVATGKDLELIMQSFAVLVGPLVQIVKFLANGFHMLNDAVGGFLPQILLGVMVLTRFSMIAKGISLVTTILGAILPAIGSAFGLLGATAPGAGAGLASFGAAASAAAFPILLIGLGIGALALGVGAMAAGFSLLVDSTKELFGTLLDAGPTKMAEMATATYGFSLAMFGLGFAVQSVAPSLLLMAMTLPTIGLMFAMMSSSVTEVAAGISSMADSLASVAGEGGIIEFTKQVNQITTENVDNLSGLMDQAERYVEVQTALKIGALVDPFVEALKQMTSVVAPAAAATAGAKKEIILEIDGREFGRAVTDVIDDKMNVSMA